MMSSHSVVDTNRIVLGTAGLAGLWGEVDPAESIDAILMALEKGIRHVDTAPAYADAERILAAALKQWKGERPFISTKAGKLRSDSAEIANYDYSPAAITRSVENSLELFGLDALDLLFLHDPTGMRTEEIPAALDCLVVLKERGWVRQIGIGGNFGAAFMPFALSDVFSHFMGYNRYNLINQVASAEEYTLLHERGMQIWQASPLYMGLLGSKFNMYIADRPEWIPSGDIDKAMRLQTEMNERNCDLTGVALNYVNKSPCVDKMVIGASNMKELETSLEYLRDNSLKEAAMELLQRDRQL